MSHPVALEHSAAEAGASSPCWAKAHSAKIGLVLALAGLWLWTAADSRLHWDEPGYWYTAAYFTVAEILAGDFQPAGIDSFSMSRIGHVLLLKSLTSMLGPGAGSLALIIGCYLLMLSAFLWLTHRILRTLLPEGRYAGAALLACALTPIFVYLAFKTLVEIPALVLSSLAALAFLMSLRSRPVLWLSVVAASLAGVAFTKNHIVLLHVSLVAALILCGGMGHPMRRIIAHAFVSGLGSLAIFFALLGLAGMPLERYLAVADFMADIRDPLAARFLSLALECGPFLLALPLAFLSPRKTHARFFALWFALATTPVLLSTRVEDRYLVSNLVALAGLVQLSIEGLSLLVSRGWAARRTTTVAVAAIGAVVLLAPTVMAQQVMFHGVRMDHLRALLRRLDQTYGADGYAIVTPSEYTTFLYLRFAYPQRAVYTVFTPAPPNHRDPKAWAEFQKRYYGQRAVHSMQSLRALGEHIVYVVPESNLTVANLQGLIDSLPRSGLRELTEGFVTKMNPGNPAAMSWMWNDPRIDLSEEYRYGHYVAMRVGFRSTQ